MRAEVRAVFLLVGAALVVVALVSATRVADTREGLIAEVVTLLSSLAAAGLLIYGLTARRGPASTANTERLRPTPIRPRTRRDLVFGGGGIVLAVVLVLGLALSGGPLWAGLGLVLLLPMIAGSIYLFVRFLRASP